jgi:hypothetical protein
MRGLVERSDKLLQIYGGKKSFWEIEEEIGRYWLDYIIIHVSEDMDKWNWVFCN